MAKVFVTQEVPLDFSKAEQFGDIVFITRDDFNNTRGSIHNEWLMSRIRQVLHKFDPEKDWLLFAGSPYVMMAVSVVLGRKGVQELQLLRWSNRDQRYMPMFMGFIGEEDARDHRAIGVRI